MPSLVGSEMCIRDRPLLRSESNCPKGCDARGFRSVLPLLTCAATILRLAAFCGFRRFTSTGFGVLGQVLAKVTPPEVFKNDASEWRATFRSRQQVSLWKLTSADDRTWRAMPRLVLGVVFENWTRADIIGEGRLHGILRKSSARCVRKSSARCEHGVLRASSARCVYE